MLKMSIDQACLRLKGPTMGAGWSAQIPQDQVGDAPALTRALQAAADEVDTQMSSWKPDSDLMRLNAAAVGQWVTLPAALMQVLAAGVQVGLASNGAFDMAMGEAVAAWGFGPDLPDETRIRAALKTRAQPAHLALEMGRDRARKTAPARFDLGGIAKGYGVDRLTQAAMAAGISRGLFSIDGEVRALGEASPGKGWGVVLERPDHGRHSAFSVIELADAAIATSGDYRHWVDVGGLRLSHTMDPDRGGPLAAGPASVSVVAPDCMTADAWATVMMVLGPERGAPLARQMGLHVLFLLRQGAGLRQVAIGDLFA